MVCLFLVASWCLTSLKFNGVCLGTQIYSTQLAPLRFCFLLKLSSGRQNLLKHASTFCSKTSLGSCNNRKIRKQLRQQDLIREQILNQTSFICIYQMTCDVIKKFESLWNVNTNCARAHVRYDRVSQKTKI